VAYSRRGHDALRYGPHSKAALRRAREHRKYSGATNVGYVSGASNGPLKNLRRVYISAVQRDTKKALYGSPPTLSRLFPDNRRRVLRRGLRTILAAYCPELLQEFEESTNARIDWVNEHRREFEKWFDQSRTDDEVAATLTEMVATQEALQEAMGSLRDFIMKNFPLPEKSLPTKFVHCYDIKFARGGRPSRRKGRKNCDIIQRGVHHECRLRAARHHRPWPPSTSRLRALSGNSEAGHVSKPSTSVLARRAS
jgi:hypothetical protein